MDEIKVLVVVDGEPVPLNECDWLWVDPSGCVIGAVMGTKANSADDAHSHFESIKKERERQLDWGFAIEIIKHVDFGTKVSPCFRRQCDHVRPEWLKTCIGCGRVGKTGFRTTVQSGKPGVRCAYPEACEKRATKRYGNR